MLGNVSFVLTSVVLLVKHAKQITHVLLHEQAEMAVQFAVMEEEKAMSNVTMVLPIMVLVLLLAALHALTIIVQSALPVQLQA